MSREEIVEDLGRIVHSVTESERDWAGELPAGELGLHFDSMQLLTLLVAVEDHFEIVLEPDDEARIQTVGDIVALIQEKTHDR